MVPERHAQRHDIIETGHEQRDRDRSLIPAGLPAHGLDHGHLPALAAAPLSGAAAGRPVRLPYAYSKSTLPEEA